MTSADGAWRLSRRALALSDSAIRALAQRLAGRNDVISFAGGMPSPATFPQDAFLRAFEAVMRSDGPAALQYGPTPGYAPLRDWIARSLSGPGHTVAAEQVLVTSGSQQGLDLIGKVLLDPGDTVAVETPTYLGALQALSQYFPRWLSLPGDAGGLIPDQAETMLRQAQRTGMPPRMLYTIPCFQNPTGRTLSLERRQALVEVCRRLQLPLIEDDPYGALDHAGVRHTPCLALDGANVLYLGSFSKVLSPGIRLGFVVAPPAVARRLEQAKQASDLHSSSLLQRLVFEIVKDGFLPGHLARCQALYRGHAQAMGAALERHLQGLAHWTPAAGGMFQWLEFEQGVDAGELLERALGAGVAFVPGAPFYAEHPRSNTARLCFSTGTAADMETGVATLARLIRESPLDMR